MKPFSRLPRFIPAAVLVLGTASLAPAQAAALWAGVDARTTGLDAHLGSALLPVPFIGTLGIEAGAATESGVSGVSEVRVGATLRDLNLPITKIDAYTSAGLSYHLSASSNSGVGLYAEGGLRGPLFGPLGWRAGLKTDTKSGFSAGLGLEVRF